MILRFCLLVIDKKTVGRQMAEKYTINLRRVTSADAKEILNVYKECEDFLALGPIPKASLEMVFDDIKSSQSQKGIFSGIIVDGQMVGVIDYIPSKFEGNPDLAFVSLIMIKKPFRGQGIGKYILSSIENLIRENSHVRRIRTASQINNPRSINFWQRNGFKNVSPPQLQPDGTTTIYLEKNLEQALGITNIEISG